MEKLGQTHDKTFKKLAKNIKINQRRTTSVILIAKNSPLIHFCHANNKYSSLILFIDELVTNGLSV